MSEGKGGRMNRQEIKNKLRGKIGLIDVCVLETDEERQLVWKLIDKDDKYSWHDLMKDPNDLPNEEYDDLLCEYAVEYFKGPPYSYGTCIGRHIREAKGSGIRGWKLHEQLEVE